MAHRKEVFQSKVLQKLFPAPSKLEKETSSPQPKQICVKRNSCPDNTAAAGQMQKAPIPQARIYTVLPPPADYKRHLETSVTLPQLESINRAKDPAEESISEGKNELDQDNDEEGKKRKRRRGKRRPTLPRDSGQDGDGTEMESAANQSESLAADEGGEHVSRNKRRKLKKKRHKEKLLSTGAMPRAAALVFTYQKDGVADEEEEDNERRAAEVSDFLRTTLEIYMSDSKQQTLLPGTVDLLLSHISSGCRPNSLLQQLHSLKVLVQQKETEKLETALKGLSDSSSVSAEETAAVVSLFQYWITDILPMREDKETRPSAAHI